MSDTGSSSLKTEEIPIEDVEPTMTLLVDEGQGRQYFQVANIDVSAATDDEGNRVVTYTLTSEPVPRDGEWVWPVSAGSTVTRVLPPKGTLFSRR